MNILILKFMFVIVALWFLRQQRQQEQRSDVNSMLSVDNNKNNFYQPKGWLPLDPTFTFVALKAFPLLLSVNKWTLFTTTEKRPGFHIR